MPYIGNQPGTGVRSRFIYTATASQTTFSGADNNSKTLKYSDADYIDVYLNGVCLVPGTDYTASTKTSVVLTQAASLSDTLEVVAYDIATISDTVSKADGGTFNGDLGITNASPDLTLTNNTTEDTDGGRESTVTFKGLQSGGEESTLAEIRASHNATADDQKGDLIFKINDGSDGSSPTERLRLDSEGRASFSNGSIVTIGNSTMGGIAGKVPDTDDFTLAVVGTGFLDSSLTLQRFDNQASGPSLLLGHSRNGTIGSSTILQDGDELGKIRFYADDGTNMDHHGGEIKVVIDGTPGANDIPSSMVFSTAADGGNSVSERMRIDSSGHVGIGTAPITDAELITSGGHGIDIESTALPRLRFYNGTSFKGGMEAIQTAGSFVAGSAVNDFGIRSQDDLLFATGGSTERMRIDTSGNLLVGKTASDGGVAGHEMRQTSFAAHTISGGTALVVRRLTNTGAVVTIQGDSGTVGTISIGSSSTAYNTSSDYRLKENVTDVTDGITRVKQLAPKRFNFIVDADTTVDGFLAHEAATVVPEAVSGTHNEVEVWAEGDDLPDGVSVGDNKLDDNGNTIPVMQGIDQAKLVPLLTAALQEAIAKIETLETKVTALEAE
jgi:hypothetical protein